MRTEMIPLAQVDSTRRLRPVNPDFAAAMADQIDRGVTLPPILVRPALPGEVADGCIYELVCGGHRMEAHRLVGLGEIRADIEEMTRAEVLFREAGENVYRNNLNPLDRAYMFRALKEAWEELYPETRHGGDRKSQTLRLGGPGRFSADAAERIGVGERTIQAAIALANALAPEALPLLRITDLVDNEAELRRLAAHDFTDQVRLATHLASGEARTVAQARVATGMDSPIERDAQEALYNKLVEGWARANAATRRRFLQHHDLVLGATRKDAR